MCAIWWPRTLVVHCLEKDVRTQEAFVARNKTGENLLCKTWHGKPILVIWHSVSTGSVLVGSREILTTLIEQSKRILNRGRNANYRVSVNSSPPDGLGATDLPVFSQQSESQKIVMFMIFFDKKSYTKASSDSAALLHFAKNVNFTTCIVH